MGGSYFRTCCTLQGGSGPVRVLAERSAIAKHHGTVCRNACALSAGSHLLTVLSNHGHGAAGTLMVTEECLLHPNRNPSLTKKGTHTPFYGAVFLKPK